MLQPRDLEIADFSYELPEERIAKYPLSLRDASKLLIYDKGALSESVFSSLADHLPAGALVVFNDSRVIQGRLLFIKPGGSRIEIFILEPDPLHADPAAAIKKKGSIRCLCLVGGAKKWKTGRLVLPEQPISLPGLKEAISFNLSAEKIEKIGEAFLVEFVWTPNIPFATALEIAGEMPIPPYLNRRPEQADQERYQTVYARNPGSVAAPTAGLHFTAEVLESLKLKGIKTTEITLHVGAGTFKPVKSKRIAGHEMHSEIIEVSRQTIHSLLENEEVIAVGTTAMRTLESLYWMGVKCLLQPDLEMKFLKIEQWEVYDSLDKHSFSKKEALEALLGKLVEKNGERLVTETRILLAPPYRPRIAKAIITNFHQPNSTLLLLIAALTGPEWKQIYQYALDHDFRFLSYGDSNLIRW